MIEIVPKRRFIMREFNIRDYGAHFSDRLQTEKIQKAIDDCFLAGGGRVVIPCGIYLTGGLRLRSGVELYLEAGAYLKGSRNPDEYYSFVSDPIEPVTMEPVGDTPNTCRSAVATSDWCNGLIRALDAENISVIGEKGSYIDGDNCATMPNGEDGFRGPHGMSIWRCKNVHLEGYTFVNSANWCHAIFQTQNITIRSVSIFGGHDGVDIRTCDNVLIEDCEFHTGDDAVAGFDDHDVIIRNCKLNSACQILRLGGNNILVENCVSTERRFGFRKNLSDEKKDRGELTDESCRHECTTPFSYYCDYRAELRKPAENIVIRNVHFAQARDLIRLQFDGLHVWCCNRSLRQITFENCYFGDLIRAGMLWGDENEKVTCTYKNCTISCREGCGKEPLFVAANYEKIVFEDCRLEGYEDPHILSATEGNVELIRSTPIRVQKATWEECIEAHPWGTGILDRKDIEEGKRVRRKEDGTWEVYQAFPEKA